MASNWDSGQGNYTVGGREGEPNRYNSNPYEQPRPKHSGSFKGGFRSEGSNHQYRDEYHHQPSHHPGDGRSSQGGLERDYNGGGQGRDHMGGGQGRDHMGGGQGRDHMGGGRGRDHMGGGRDRDYYSEKGHGRDRYSGGGRSREYNGGGHGRDYSGRERDRGYNRDNGGNHYETNPNERYGSRSQQHIIPNPYQSEAGRYGSSRRDGGSGEGYGHVSRGRSSESSGRGENREATPSMAYQSPSNRPRDEEDIFDTIPQGANFSHYDSQKFEITGDDAPASITTFDEASLSQTVKENIAKSNYHAMTPIQKCAIPVILADRDLMGCAETGSGKTAAFLIPIISMMLKQSMYSNPNIDGCLSPTTLILAPTRELALQIYQESQKFAFSSQMKTGIYYGGTSLMHQQRVLSEGCHILVATPGRLLDCLEKKKVTLSQVRFLVIDEADRMLDMGFIPSVKTIVFNFDLPNKTHRRTIMFSATFPDEIQRISCDFLSRKYLFVTVGKSGAPVNAIKQKILCVSQSDKLNKLMELLVQLQGQKVLVFVENKRQADLLASQVCQEHMQATSIHGSRMQQEREQALFEFKSGRRAILIATAVAARGLDIKKVDHVINYDLPRSDMNEYVHRIGRTGRIGNSGMSTSFFDPRIDACVARSLVHFLAMSEQEVPVFLDEIAYNAIGTNTGVGPSCGEFGGTDYRNHSSPRSREHSHQSFRPDVQGSYDQHPMEQTPLRAPPTNPAQSSPKQDSKDSAWH